MFDLDNDGVLGRVELGLLLRTRLGLEMTEEDMDEFIGMADTSGTGQIGYKDFCLMMGGSDALTARNNSAVKTGTGRGTIDKEPSRQGTFTNGTCGQETFDKEPYREGTFDKESSREGTFDKESSRQNTTVTTD